METEIIKSQIDRELNPLPKKVFIAIPRDTQRAIGVKIFDENKKMVGFIQKLSIHMAVNHPFWCTITRVLIHKKDNNIAHAMIDVNKDLMTETFDADCHIDTYEMLAPDAFVTLDPAKNPTNQQLKDSLGCRICGMKTEVMFTDKDGAKCEKHRGQATQLLAGS
jgi:hypothetical protein